MIALLLVTIVFALFLIFPFLISIFTSMVLAYIFYPFYIKLNKYLKRENLSAFIVSFLIVIMLAIPLAFVFYHVSQEVNIGYILIKQKLASGNFIEGSCDSGFICSISQGIENLILQPQAKFYITDSLNKLSTGVAGYAFDFVFSLPKRVLDIFITFFITFFLLRDGKKFVKFIEKETPISAHERERIFKQMSEVVRAIVYGFFLVAVLEGVIMGLTFWLANVTSPILWGIIVSLLALVPMIGGAVVWIPAMIISFVGGNLWPAVVIAVGGLIVSGIDTFLKPKVIGNKAKIRPVLVVIGVLGGISVIGLAGVIIGPLVLALLVTFVQMYMGR